MRNLKRALSLALASVMTLGMMTVGASAKGISDFSDAAEITNVDAVAVTSAVGIFKGYDDGEFKGSNVVTRAEMAVICAKLLYGADVDPAQFVGTSTFTDTPAWAEGYINLCASLGIIAGRGNGIFDPSATVSTVEAASMLTKTLGYFKNQKDYGTDWKLAVTAKATQLGLYGDLKLAADTGLTRDNVAELVFNTMTKAVPVQYNELLGVYYNNNQGIIYALEFNYLETLGYKNFDLVYKTVTDTMYGRPGTVWGTGSYKYTTTATSSGNKDDVTADGGLISSKVRMLDKDEIITVNQAPDYVFEAATSENDVFDALGSKLIEEKDPDLKYTWTFYRNGKNVTETDAEYPEDGETGDYEFTDKGAVLEVYIDDADQTVTLCEINYYLGEVSTVKSDDDGEYVNVKALSSGADLDDKKFYTNELEKGDLVVFTVDEDKSVDKDDPTHYYIAEMFTPGTVSGEVTRVETEKGSKNAYVRLNGESTKYFYAGADHNVYDLNNSKDVHPELKEDYVFYLTPTGYILGFELLDETTTQYLYVKDSDEEMKDWIAKVILTDASSAKVEVKSGLKGAGSGESDKVEWLPGYNKETTTNIDGRIWKYSVNDAGAYTLTWVTSLEEKNMDINNGKAYIEESGTDGLEILIDEDTIFVDTMNDKTYVGYSAVPNIEDAHIEYVLDSHKVAEVVYILDGEIYDKDSTYFMLTKEDHDTLKYDGEYYREYFYANVNGEIQTLSIAYDALEGALYDQPLEKGVLYKAVKTIDEEYITKVEVADAKYQGQLASVGHNAFRLEDNEVNSNTKKFDTDDETTFVFVEANYKKAGGFDKWVIDEGDISELKDLLEEYEETKGEEFAYNVRVIESSSNYAELVYVIIGEAAKVTAVEAVLPTASNLTGLSVEDIDTLTDGQKVAMKAQGGYDAVAKAGVQFVAGEYYTITINGQVCVAKADANGEISFVYNAMASDMDSKTLTLNVGSVEWVKAPSAAMKTAADAAADAVDAATLVAVEDIETPDGNAIVNIELITKGDADTGYTLYAMDADTVVYEGALKVSADKKAATEFTWTVDYDYAKYDINVLPYSDMIDSVDYKWTKADGKIKVEGTVYAVKTEK